MKISRRKFIKVAGGVGLAVAAGSIRWPQHVTAGSPTTLRVLGHSAFNEDSDKAIITIGNDFARQHNATFAGDFIDQPEVAAKLTAEEQAKAGHDIVDLQDNLPTIHKDYLVPLDDVVADITGKFGPFYQVAKDSGYVDGHWLTLPWIGNGTLGVYRADYFAAVGEQPSASWDDLLRAATKLKKAGHPVGLPISQCEDADSIFFPLLWSFGGSVADAKNKLTLDSPQTRAALGYMRKLFAEMDATVLSWDDSGNNKHMLSGRGSYTINAPSIYLRAQRDKMAFAPSMRHTLAPSGPKGRFFYADIHGWGIFKFSPNVDLAKQFLRSMFTEASQKTALTLGSGYDMPVLPYFDKNPPYASDPNLRLLVGFMRDAHLVAYPAPPNALAEKTYQTYVIPNMFAKAVQGASDDAAIAFAIKALTDIGYTK
jgi:multiple sugar transport system substrate-binding protein